MPSNRTALVVVLAGLLLVPGPAYAFALEDLDGPERHRTSAGYAATPIEFSNDTLLADRYGPDLAFRPSALRYRHVRERYRAPNRTRAALETAIETGSAPVESDAVATDIRALRRNYTFLTVEYDVYYAFDLADGTVTTSVVNESAVARAVREQLVVNASALSPAERRTVRKIRNATASDEASGYRPWSDEPVPDRPIVAYNGTYYAIEVTSHTDDFGLPDGLVLGLVASAVGVAAVLGGVGAIASNHWRS